MEKETKAETEKVSILAKAFCDAAALLEPGEQLSIKVMIKDGTFRQFTCRKLSDHERKQNHIITNN